MPNSKMHEEKPLANYAETPETGPKDELVFWVSLFIGYSRELQHHEMRLGRLLKVTDKIEVSSENTLLDLKRSFSCPADYSFDEDFSEKEPTINDISKNKFPSSFFFIHDTFYIDTENPNAEDISLPIRLWAEKRSKYIRNDDADAHKAIGRMHVVPMSSLKIGDLSARMGQPYVYVHQGVCEHLVCFTDAFLKDNFHTNCTFPRRLVERNFRRIACKACKSDSAKWMVLNHEDLPSSPMFLCNMCYREFCFLPSQSGQPTKKTCDFKAIPYCDRKEVGEDGKFISSLRF